MAYTIMVSPITASCRCKVCNKTEKVTAANAETARSELEGKLHAAGWVNRLGWNFCPQCWSKHLDVLRLDAQQREACRATE